MKKPQMKNVKLFGGPLNGQTVAVSRSADSYRVGPFWRYTYAGKDGRLELFAIAPKSRIAGRFMRWYVRETGKDPRIEAEFTKQRPILNPSRVAHGRGAARRKAARDGS